MTLRKSASALFAALLASASLAAVANAQTMHHRAARHSHAAAHGGMPAHSTTAGNAATDALNEQSLNAARNGTAPSVAPTSPAAPTSSTPAQ